MAARQSPLMQPRLAELVARELRQEILSGAYADVELLPRQQQLIDRFRVSPPSVREALRILEAEGLISVLRGREGGAIVHPPRLEKVTYMLGMVLQAEAVPVEDAVAAYGRLEPALAAQCSEREDRAETVVPALHENLARARDVVDDAHDYRLVAKQFHNILVSHSENRTVTALIGVLNTLVSSQVRRLANESGYLQPFDDLAMRQASLREHEALAEAIAAGDPARVYTLAREHMSEAHWPTPRPVSPPIVDPELLL
jgi:GntR family transcriptional repressor for pyruvate dehydrogenase complex